MSALAPLLQRLARNRLLDVAVALLTLAFLARLLVALPASAQRNDFAHYYLSSRLLIEGGNPYTTSLAPLAERFGFEFDDRVPTATNPPLLLWMFVPFAALPVKVAFWSWFGVQAASLGLILWLTWRQVREELSRRALFFFCSAVLTSGAVYWHFRYAQVQLPLAALVLAGFCWMRGGRPFAACAAVAIAGMVKLFPLALLPWFIWRGGRDGRQRLQLAAVTGALMAGLVIVTGTGVWGQFIEHSRQVLASNAVGYTFNFTAPSFVINLGLAQHGFAAPAETAQTWWRIGVALGGVVLLLGHAACRLKSTPVEREFGWLSVAMLVGGLTAWGHYHVFLIFPAATVVAVIVARPSAGRVVLLVVMFALLSVQGTVASPWLDQHLTLKVLLNYLPLLGQLLMAGLLLCGRNRTCA